MKICRSAYKAHSNRYTAEYWDYAGLAKAGGVGVAKGAIGLAGIPGDLQTSPARRASHVACQR
jgi:hypothetical protein